MKKKNKMTIDIIIDNSLIIPEYKVDFQNKTKKTIEIAEHIEKLRNIDQQKKDLIDLEMKDNKKFVKKPFKKKKFFKKI